MNETSTSELSTGVPEGKAYRGVEWMKPAWIIALLLGIAGGIASFNFGSGERWSIEGALVATMLNPLVFIGLPLAFYWWSRAVSGFQCPKCGRRNSWSHPDVRRLTQGK